MTEDEYLAAENLAHLRMAAKVLESMFFMDTSERDLCYRWQHEIQVMILKYEALNQSTLTRE